MTGFQGADLATFNVDSSVTATNHSTADEDGTTIFTGNHLDDLKDKVKNGVNSTITLTVDPEELFLNLDTLAIKVNETTLGVNKPIYVTLSTNRTGDKFLVGDSINWFGTTYEITEINSTTVKLGETSEVTVNVGDEFTLGGKTFTLTDLSSGTTQALVTDSSGNRVTLNSTYTTFDGIKMKINSVFSGSTVKQAIIQSVVDKYSLWDNKQFPINTNWTIETLTTDGTNVSNDIIVVYNLTPTLSEGQEVVLNGDIKLTYQDNDNNGKDADFGNAATINITEMDALTMTMDGDNTEDGGTGWDVVADIASLPGVKTYKVCDEVATEITDLTTHSSNCATNQSDPLYIRDSAGYYELKILATGDTDVYFYRPDTPENRSLSLPSSWIQIDDSVNYTTPSGLLVYTLKDKLVVEAIDVTIDKTIYYGRKNTNGLYSSSGLKSEVYNKYGLKVTWDGDKVKVKEPTGVSWTVDVTFDNGYADFNRSDITYSVGDVDFWGITDSSGNERYQESDWGTKFGNLTALDDPSHASAGKFVLAPPQKKIELGVGGYANITRTLSTGETITIGDTTAKVGRVVGQAVIVNPVTVGIGAKVSDITTSTLSKPIILIGGPAINTLVSQLASDGKATALDNYTANHAFVELVENAFNNKTALIIAGYSASDTVMACKVVAQQLLTNGPFNSTQWTGSKVELATGVTSVDDVTIVS